MTDNDKDLLLNGEGTIPFRINIINGNETTELTEYDIINLSYEDFRYVDTSSLVVGQFVARKITGELSGLHTQFEIEDTELEIKIGIHGTIDGTEVTHWYSLGNFLVTKPTSDDVKDKTTFEALDYTKKFNQAFDDSNLTYPCTAMELAEEVCRQCGVELATNSFTNNDFVINDNQYTENDSCRKVMQDIGKLAYSWVRIGWDNKCYIDYEVESQVYDYSHNIIQTNKYYDLNKQNKVFGPVNRVVIGMENVEGENAYVEDTQSIAEYGVTELQIYDNNLTYTPELRQQVIDGARRLFGLTYLPLEVNTVGHPWLIGKEKIGVVDANGDTLYTYPFDRTIEYKGHIKTKLTSKAETKIETEYKNTGTLENEMRKTRIIVDKQNQTIEALAEEVVPVSNTISGIGSITLDSAYEGTLHRLEIMGNIHELTPSNSLHPSNTLYTIDTTIVVDDTKYYPDFKYLNYINSQVCDKYVYEDGKQWVERNVGVDNEGNLYQLSSTIIEESDNELIIKVSSSSNISMQSFPNASFRSTYLLDNQYTDTFAPSVDLVAKINLSPGLAQIDAQRISLAGKTIEMTSEDITIDSTHFKVDKYGNAIMNNAIMNTATMNNANVIGGTIKLGAGSLGLANLEIGKSSITQSHIEMLGEDSTDDFYNRVVIQRPESNGTQGMFSLYGRNYYEYGSLSVDSEKSELYLEHNDNLIRLSTNYTGYNDKPYMYITDGTNTTSLSATAVWSQAFNNVSTEDAKKNIKLYNTSGLDVIKNTDIYSFNYKAETNQDKKHIGVVIGDDYKYSKEITANDEKGIDLYSMVSICFKAIKEQQEQIEMLQKEMIDLKNERSDK